MRELLASYGIEAVSAGELGLAEPEETGTTFRGERADQGGSRRAGQRAPAFADDSGLAVDALGRRARHPLGALGGTGEGFSVAMEKVEARLRERGATRRSSGARISSRRCASPGPTAMWRNSKRSVDGTLVWPPRGTKGFGYDPMFLPDGHTRTFGEMESEEKHGLPPRGKGLSHRARAFLKLAEACLGKR